MKCLKQRDIFQRGMIPLLLNPPHVDKHSFFQRVSSPRFINMSKGTSTLLCETDLNYHQPFKKVNKYPYNLQLYLFC